MSDWVPQVTRIQKLEKHPDADNLSIATVLGDYPVIVKLGEYTEGQLVGYIPIDSIVPDIKQFYFLCPKSYEKYEENGEIKQRIVGNKYELGSVPEKNRIIKAKSLRGIYSQGMLVTVPADLNEGDSIVELFSLKKWEESEEDNLPTVKSRGANADSPPKGWSIPYYDIDGLRKYSSCFEGEEVILNEKIHGCNFSASYDGEKLYVKSRNFYKRFDRDDMWWDAAIRYDLENKLKKYPMFVFFAELAGNIKKFRYNAQVVSGKLHTKLYFFDIWDVKQNKFLNYDNFKSIINDLQLEIAPELYRGPWLDKDKIYEYAEGKSVTDGITQREGFVCKTVVEKYEAKSRGRKQFKLVSKGYNLLK